MDNTDNERYSDYDAICPWCDMEQTDAWEMKDGRHQCESCDKFFELDSYVTRHCTTTRKLGWRD